MLGTFDIKHIDDTNDNNSLFRILRYNKHILISDQKLFVFQNSARIFFNLSLACQSRQNSDSAFSHFLFCHLYFNISK